MKGKSVAEIIQQSGVKFGTSGARGLVAQFTEDVTAAFAVAFVDALQCQGIKVFRVALGVDRRPSSPEMARVISGVLTASGIQVHYYGILPTPALALKALEESIPAIMVTGSHIPFDRNGIKFYRPDGEITKQDEQAILASNAQTPEFPSCSLQFDSAAIDGYTARYADAFSNELLKGLRIGVYEHSAAGRDLSKDILRRLGAEVVSLGKTDTFVPIDTEAVSIEDQQQAKRWSEEYGFDAIFSTDGDGDRPLIADENGHWLKGDVVGMLCAKYIQASALAVPVSCNSSVEAYTGVKVIRTKIGSPYVIDAMSRDLCDYDVVAGFEANGGFLTATPFVINGKKFSALPTRDALLPLLAILSVAQQKSVSISQLVAELPQRFTASDRVTEFATEKSANLISTWTEDVNQCLLDLAFEGEISDVNSVDGLRLLFKDGNIVHLRPSGNAPEFRCYCESDSLLGAEQVLLHVLGKLKSMR